MTKRLRIILVSVGAIILALILVFGGMALAENKNKGKGLNNMPPGRGMAGNHPVINDTLTKLLGMTQSEIQTQLRAGKSLVEIAATKNIDEQTLVNALVDPLNTKLKEAVANQDITQKVADARLQQSKDNISKMVNNKYNAGARPGWGAPPSRGGRMNTPFGSGRPGFGGRPPVPPPGRGPGGMMGRGFGAMRPK